MKISAVFLFLACVLLPFISPGQHLKFYGIILNEETGMPVANVNLSVRNTKTGTATNPQGKFELFLNKLPVYIDITCIGYKALTIEVGEVMKKQVEIRLKPQVRLLESITISEQKATAVYKDADYSVLDYEIMGDNLLVLIFRYQLKRSTMLLLNPDGDTLAQVPLPELPPDKLYKDAFGNVHYFSKKGQAFQCHYNPSLDQFYFPFQTTTDSIYLMLGHFSFVLNDRLYFQEDYSNGFRTNIGYYDLEKGKRYLHAVRHDKAESDYYRDKYFFSAPSRAGDTVYRETDERAYDFFAQNKHKTMMVKLGNDRVAVFNFSGNVIDIFDADWNMVNEIPITFHKDQEYAFIAALANSFFPDDTWKWGGKLLKDDANGAVYTSFIRHGNVRLCRIDVESGRLTNEFVIPLPFPEKIMIHRGQAFFLYKECGPEHKRKLYKMQL